MMHLSRGGTADGRKRPHASGAPLPPRPGARSADRATGSGAPGDAAVTVRVTGALTQVVARRLLGALGGLAEAGVLAGARLLAELHALVLVAALARVPLLVAVRHL